MGGGWSTDKAKTVGEKMLFEGIKYAMREVVNARGGDIGVKPAWAVRAEPVEPVVVRGGWIRFDYFLLDGAASFELLSLSRGRSCWRGAGCAREVPLERWLSRCSAGATTATS